MIMTLSKYAHRFTSTGEISLKWDPFCFIVTLNDEKDNYSDLEFTIDLKTL